MFMARFIKAVPILTILFLSLLVILPFFNPSFFPTHDGVWVPVRLAEMIRELKDLQIPPRMSGYLNHGYGYPLFNFAYPFPYYLGTLFYLLGFGLVGSTKLLFALTVPLSGLFMYLLSKHVWKSSLAGVVSAILYMFLPYRIVDLYARGSIGESLSFVLFPVILYLALTKRWLLLSVSIAVLITTHNIMAILYLPIFIILFFILSDFQFSALRHLILYTLLGFGLSAYFWLPALFEKQYIALSKIPIADRFLYFVKPLELVIPKWGYGLPTNPDGFGYQLGIPQTIAFVFAFLLALIKKSKAVLSICFLIIFLIFMMLEAANPLWQLPFLKEINYPWTLLAPLGFLIAFLSGFLTKNKLSKIVVIFLSIFAIAFTHPHAKPSSFTSYEDSFYQSNDATTTSSDELMPLWVNPKPSSRPSQISSLQTLKDSSNHLVLENTLQKDSYVVLNKIYYPGWVWSTDSKTNKNGLIELSVKKGNQIVEGKFTETPLRIFADIISLVSLLIIFVLLTAKLRRWRK